MRDTIDFGIDLGNNEGWEYTPPAVWMPKPDVVHVGRKARERTEKDPDNAFEIPSRNQRGTAR